MEKNLRVICMAGIQDLMNYRQDILVEKLKSLDRDNLKRLKIASIYNKAITSKHVITPKKEEILLMFTIYTLLNVRTEINY